MCGWWLATFLTLATPAAAEPIAPEDIRVVDGDTIHINNPKVGAPSGLEAIGPRPNVRLVGFDAPETWRPVRKAKAMAGDEPERIFQQAIRFYQAQKILESSPNDQREALVPPVCVLAAFTSELMLKCLIRRRACATTCSFGCRACTGPSANRAGTDEHALERSSLRHLRAAFISRSPSGAAGACVHAAGRGARLRADRARRRSAQRALTTA